jgi:hypothetical protein
MPILANPRHDRFAQLVASGKFSHSEAFRQAGYAENGAKENASRLMTNDNVSARIEELRARNAEKCQLSRDQAVQYLVEILKTPIGEVNVDHRLCQSYDAKSGKVELPSKLGAMQLLAKMCGWLEPEKHEVGANSELTELLKRLRGGSPG